MLDELRLFTWHRWLFPSETNCWLDRYTSAHCVAKSPFRFFTLHPFDDGNGRLTLAITDLALAHGEQQAIRFYDMPASILDDRAGYYRILEASQKDGPISPSGCSGLSKPCSRAWSRPLLVSSFWQAHRSQTLSTEQIRVLNRLLDGGERGFEDGISAAQ